MKQLLYSSIFYFLCFSNIMPEDYSQAEQAKSGQLGQEQRLSIEAVKIPPHKPIQQYPAPVTLEPATYYWQRPTGQLPMNQDAWRKEQQKSRFFVPTKKGLLGVIEEPSIAVGVLSKYFGKKAITPLWIKESLGPEFLAYSDQIDELFNKIKTKPLLIRLSQDEQLHYYKKYLNEGKKLAIKFYKPVRFDVIAHYADKAYDLRFDLWRSINSLCQDFIPENLEIDWGLSGYTIEDFVFELEKIIEACRIPTSEPFRSTLLQLQYIVKDYQKRIDRINLFFPLN